jgi:hypothetical protein
MPGVGTRPSRMSCPAMRLPTSTGMAKPIPADAPDQDMIALFTPMSRPALSSNGPPELPGLIGASVWITPLISCDAAVGNRRCSALMMPE